MLKFCCLLEADVCSLIYSLIERAYATPKILHVIFLFIVFALLFFLFVLEMRKTHRQLIICSILVAQKNCSILRMCVCILVVEKAIVADICSLLVCAYVTPKI